ncbi:non-homologous end joining protein Ku [Streptomyces atratus]
MPSTIWSGAISFGLVTIPIKAVSATEDHSIRSTRSTWKTWAGSAPERCARSTARS